MGELFDKPMARRTARVKRAAGASAGLGLAIICVAWPLDLVLAGPLAKEACEALNVEHVALQAAGVKDDIAKGPDWAKANVKLARLKDIQRVIELEEQLNFRCGLASVKLNVPEPPTPEASASVTPDAQRPKPKAIPKARPKVVPEAAAAPVAQPDAVGSKGPAVAAPKVEVKPKSKPKLDDAFRPVPVNPNADPFSKQVAPKG